MSAAPSFHESAATGEAGVLYERYGRQLLGFCRARLGSREEAEDALQQAFLNAHRSLRGGTVPRAEAAWMFAIAANVCRERRRSAWRRSRVEVVSDDGLVGDRAAPEQSHEELSGVADALAELTPNQRRAILMREWQGLSYREIAAELSLSEGAVETLIFRARRSLARKLDRSRRHVWGISNIGSALAWGKAALSGTAAQVAAATLVVGGAGGAAPIVLLHGSTPTATVPVRQATAFPASFSPPARVRAPNNATPASAPRLATDGPAAPAARRAHPPSPPVPAPATTPSQPVSVPVTVAQPAPPPPVASPAPQLPKIEVPPIPPVPSVAALPQLPPVSVPSVLLPLPPLPKLP